MMGMSLHASYFTSVAEVVNETHEMASLLGDGLNKALRV